jgi:hypothetical protein
MCRIPIFITAVETSNYKHKFKCTAGPQRMTDKADSSVVMRCTLTMIAVAIKTFIIIFKAFLHVLYKSEIRDSLSQKLFSSEHVGYFTNSY